MDIMKNIKRFHESTDSLITEIEKWQLNNDYALVVHNLYTDKNPDWLKKRFKDVDFWSIDRRKGFCKKGTLSGLPRLADFKIQFYLKPVSVRTLENARKEAPSSADLEEEVFLANKELAKKFGQAFTTQGAPSSELCFEKIMVRYDTASKLFYYQIFLKGI